ncbi:hypothetical protein PtrSN002B_012157 [Pyrenophora tritici-repentis]|nr:hypothetical protein PtrSN002B_012157 [Pyrenophora tritici-repentis]
MSGACRENVEVFEVPEVIQAKLSRLSDMAGRAYNVLWKEPQGNTGVHASIVSVRLHVTEAQAQAALEELESDGLVYHTETRYQFAVEEEWEDLPIILPLRSAGTG